MKGTFQSGAGSPSIADVEGGVLHPTAIAGFRGWRCNRHGRRPPERSLVFCLLYKGDEEIGRFPVQSVLARRTGEPEEKRPVGYLG